MVATTIISVIVYVLSVIGMWMTFRKAGRMGWLSIIPVVNTIVICLIGWQKVWPFIVEVVVGAIGVIMTLFGGLLAILTGFGMGVGTGPIIGLLVVGVVLMIIALIIYIMITHRLSKSFGHGAGYTVGLILIPLIMYLVLGFGKSEYIYEKKRDFGRKDSSPSEQ